MKSIFIAAAIAAVSTVAHAQGLTLWTNGASEPAPQQPPQVQQNGPLGGLISRFTQQQPQADKPASVCCPLTIAGYDCPQTEPHCK
jgi:uncharacterized protein YdeI (BOF family)